MTTITKKTAGWLVMAAARMALGSATATAAARMAAARTRQALTIAAAAAVMGLATTACSSSGDGLAEEPTPTPAGNTDAGNSDAQKKYTMTVKASKGGHALTRALSYDDVTKGLSATWKAGDKVKVYAVDLNNGTFEELLGELTALSDGAETTLSGTITPPSVGTFLALFFPRYPVTYTGQKGTLDDIAANFDYATATLSNYTVTEGGTITYEKPVTFENQQAIVRFTLKDKDDNAIQATSLTISDVKGHLLRSLEGSTPTFGDLTINPETPASEIWAALAINYPSMHISMTATTEDGETYTFSKEGVNFNPGEFYSITVKMTRQPRTYDLSQASGNITLKDGDVLTGRLAGSYNISIADGATVTLNEAYISSEEYVEWNWLGITCLGDATIVLSGENDVTSTVYKPAIQAGPEGTTLTITGTGTLTAGSDGDGAAIGSGYEGTCGDIIITGGTVKAMCSNNGAAIGSSQGGSCGDIIITGGTVTATSYGTGAGIGSGNGGNCGKIIISGGSVTATGGIDAAGIGNALDGHCEAIYITNGVTRVEADNSDEYSDSRYPSIGLPGSEVRIGCWYDTEWGVYQGGTLYWINVYENNGEDYLNQHPLIYKP